LNRIVFPKSIIELISTLEDAGHQAYAVGGAVRDALIGLPAHDWDIACSALPKEVLALFGDRAIATGLKHGTVTVKTGSASIEVTTFRTDGQYLDSRRPESVRFVTSIEEDLARRDFTINAIAASVRGKIIDPFGGQDDIAARLIRCVGDASLRFKEDALRMFRAIRFKAKLGFDIEESTMTAIRANASIANALAVDRIFSELDRALVCGDMLAFNIMLTTSLLSFLGVEPRCVDFSSLAALPCNRHYRWVGFCHILFETKDKSDCFLARLRADNLVRGLVNDSFDIMSTCPQDKISWKRLLSNFGVTSCKCAVYIMSTESQALLDEILQSGDCYSLANLAVSGKDLIRLGFEGEMIGKVLNRLLDYVIIFPEYNNKEKLLEMAKNTPEL